MIEDKSSKKYIIELIEARYANGFPRGNILYILLVTRFSGTLELEHFRIAIEYLMEKENDT